MCVSLYVKNKCMYVCMYALYYYNYYGIKYDGIQVTKLMLLLIQ